MKLKPILELKNISKKFGAVHALNDTNFYINKGEVLGLIGDNGAGKSSLMKVINGVYIPDTGKYVFEGEEKHLKNPRDAAALGIEMVFQDFALLDNLDISENIFLGREIYKNILGFNVLNRKKMAKESEEIVRGKLNLEIDSILNKVKNLSGGQRQGVAISRALLFDPKLLILDEPTASLSVDKIKNVLDLIKKLKELGIAVILISHRLQEIMEVCDRISVMYRGKIISDLITSETNMNEIVTCMVGGNVKVY